MGKNHLPLFDYLGGDNFMEKKGRVNVWKDKAKTFQEGERETKRQRRRTDSGRGRHSFEKFCLIFVAFLCRGRFIQLIPSPPNGRFLSTNVATVLVSTKTADRFTSPTNWKKLFACSVSGSNHRQQQHTISKKRDNSFTAARAFSTIHALFAVP